MAGIFISFEGIDGVGKTTQIQRLAEYLRQQYHKCVVVTLEPGATSLGAQLRNILLHTDAPIDARTEALLYAADRSQHVSEVIIPALERGDIVISDRYIDSSIAYQAGGRELGEHDIKNLNIWATGNVMPNRTYVLDMDVLRSQERLHGELDRIESAGVAFRERTREQFLALAHQDPERFCVVSADQTIEAVWEEIRADINQLMERENQCATAQSAMEENVVDAVSAQHNAVITPQALSSVCLNVTIATHSDCEV